MVFYLTFNIFQMILFLFQHSIIIIFHLVGNKKTLSLFGPSNQTLHKNTMESPILHPQLLFKFEVEPTRTNLENVQKNQAGKCSEENTDQFPSKTILKSKLNPNAKGFVFNPITEPFVPISKISI